MWELFKLCFFYSMKLVDNSSGVLIRGKKMDFRRIIVFFIKKFVHFLSSGPLISLECHT